MSGKPVEIDAGRRPREAMPAPSVALSLAREAGQDIVTRDRFIAQAVAGGDSPAVVAGYLGLSRQQVYAILEDQRLREADRVRGEATWEEQSAWRATETRLEEMASGEEFERLVHVLLYDIDPSVRPVGGVGDRARDAVGDLAHGDHSIFSISIEKEWARKIRREVKRIVNLGYKPAFVYAVTNRKTTRVAEERLERWADELGIRLRVLSQRWLVSKLVHPDYVELRRELLGLSPRPPKVFLSSREYRDLLDGRPASLGLHTRRVGSNQLSERLRGRLQVRPAIVLTGPGGIGKTRLVLDLAEHAEPGHVWRFLDEATVLRPDALGELMGTEEMVVVIDNAHRRHDLEQVLGLLERRRPRPKVIFVVRPQRVEPVEEAARSVWIGQLSYEDYVTVPRLRDPEIAQLVRGEPFAVSYDGMVRAIVRLAEGNPQIAVLAAQLARDGMSIAELTRAEVFGEYVSALLTTVTDRAAEARQLREVLAVIAALGSIDRQDDRTVARVSQLVGFAPAAVKRWLLELADLGLLIEQPDDVFVIKPDVLAEHTLVASFFTERWQPVLDYRDVVRAFAADRLEQLCVALGQVPFAKLNPSDPGILDLRSAIDPIIVRGELVRPAKLVRALLPGAESFGLPLLEALIGRAVRESHSMSREAAEILVEATQRVNQDIAAGWRLLLRLTAAMTDPKAIDVSREAMKSIYRRVPVRMSDQDGWVLAEVQTTVAKVTRAYARRAHTAGQVRAATAAAHALLMTTFEAAAMSVETHEEIVLSAYAVPGTEATKEALLVGMEVITSTFAATDSAEQLRTIEEITELARRAAGFPAGFGVRLDGSARARAEQALSRFDEFLAGQFDELALPVRASALTYVLARRAWLTRRETNAEEDGELHLPPLPKRSDELDEYILLFYPKPVEPPAGRPWEEEQRETQALSVAIARRLASEASWREHLAQWERWRAQTAELFDHRPSPALQLVMTALAHEQPVRAVEIIDELIDVRLELRTQLAGAIHHLIESGHANDQSIDRWLDADETTRATLALATADLDSESATRALRTLARDDSEMVRRAVLNGIRFGQATTEWRIELGLGIAEQLADIDAVHTLLMVAGAGHLPLTPRLGGPARRAVLASATVQRIDTYDLAETLRRLEPITGDLTLEWVWRRIDWLQTIDQRAWMLDLLPDALSSRIREHSTRADLDEALRRFARVGTPSLASDALSKLLNWIDPAAPQISELIADYYDDPDQKARVYRLLQLELSWDECRQRAETLAERVDDDAVWDLVHAKLPAMWSGSRVPHLQAALEHVKDWGRDSPSSSFRRGITATAAKLEAMITRENERDRQEEELSPFA